MKARRTTGSSGARGTKKTGRASNGTMKKTVAGRVKKVTGKTDSVASDNEGVTTAGAKRTTRRAVEKDPAVNETPESTEASPKVTKNSARKGPNKPTPKPTNSTSKPSPARAEAGPKTTKDSVRKSAPTTAAVSQSPKPRKRAPAKRKPAKVVVPLSKRPIVLEEDSSSSGEDSETDSELDEEAMSKTDWYITKSKTCQKCKTDYEMAGEASTCLTSHTKLRCYFCFRVCKNTEMLFQHFDRVHRKAENKPSTVECPCCKQIIPFKGVSCHVISMHLTHKNQPSGPAKSRKQPAKKKTSTAANGKDSTGETRPKKMSSSVKKARTTK